MQLISEFVIAEIRPEDSGSFYCSAANPAGVATANFTVVVVSDREGEATSSGGNVISDGDGDTITVVGDDKEGDGGDEDTMIKVSLDYYRYRLWEHVSYCFNFHWPEMCRTICHA